MNNDPKQGAGIRFLTETVTSPTLAAQFKGILTEFPQAKWHQYEPVNNDNARAGAVMAFGQPVNTIYDFSKADRILSLDADFLSAHPGHVEVCARLRGAPPHQRRQERNESALRDRDDADDDRRERGSSLVGKAERARKLRARHLQTHPSRGISKRSQSFVETRLEVSRR